MKCFFFLRPAPTSPCFANFGALTSAFKASCSFRVPDCMRV